MAQFRLQYPGIQFHLRVASPAAVTVAVLNGDADVGLTYSRSADRDITVQHRQAAPVIAIMRPDHALARAHSVTLAQMHAYPIALPERDNTVRQLFDIGCSQRGLVFEPALVCNCRIPDDCIDFKRYPLFMARSVLQELIKSLQSTQGVKPC